MTVSCALCWFTFDTDEALAAHVEMEEALDWPLDGAGPGPEDEPPARPADWPQGRS